MISPGQLRWPITPRELLEEVERVVPVVLENLRHGYVDDTTFPAIQCIVEYLIRARHVMTQSNDKDSLTMLERLVQQMVTIVKERSLVPSIKKLVGEELRDYDVYVNMSILHDSDEFVGPWKNIRFIEEYEFDEMLDIRDLLQSEIEVLTMMCEDIVDISKRLEESDMKLMTAAREQGWEPETASAYQVYPQMVYWWRYIGRATGHIIKH